MQDLSSTLPEALSRGRISLTNGVSHGPNILKSVDAGISAKTFLQDTAVSESPRHFIFGSKTPLITARSLSPPDPSECQAQNETFLGQLSSL